MPAELLSMARSGFVSCPSVTHPRQSEGKRSRPEEWAGGEEQLEKGTVKWFNEQKGFGFIRPDDGGDDLFVHHTSIRVEGFRSLREGQAVQFERGEGPKGPVANNVSPA